MVENTLHIFDTAVKRFLSARMSADEENAFKKVLDGSEELKKRATLIAIVIKATQELGAKLDSGIIAHIKTCRRLL